MYRKSCTDIHSVQNIKALTSACFYKEPDIPISISDQDASGASDRGVRFPFKNDKPRKDHIHSWTTDNPDPNAKYPRLSTIEGMNYVSSSFWVVNTAYLKLKSLEIGYNFEQRLLKKLHVDNLRVYLNFYNLWTIYSDMPKDFDVENQNYNAYPQQFVTSLGVNITF